MGKSEVSLTEAKGFIGHSAQPQILLNDVLKFPVSLLLLLLLGIYWITGNEVPVIFSLAVLLFLYMISGLGHKLIIPEAMAFYIIMIYLLFPLWGYQRYPAQHPLSTLFDVYMRVPREEYFEFAIPAVILFISAMFNAQRNNDISFTSSLFTSARTRLAGVQQVGVVLIVTALMAYFLGPRMPSGLQYVLQLGFLAIIPGLFYLYFQPGRGLGKTVMVLTGLAWLFYLAIKSTMFTLIVYMGIASLGFLFIGRKISMAGKVAVFSILLIVGLVMQYTKANYRNLIRVNKAESGDIRVFSRLFLQNLVNIDQAVLDGAFFPIYMRGNQGYLLSRVMEHVPGRKPHDGGRLLGKTLVSSFIPRLFWPNKPEAGGRFNIEYYTSLKLSRRTSMNVGPIGEGYGAFGKWGGMLYMIFFGTALGLANRVFLNTCTKLPLLLFWQPLVFYEVIYCMENDSMQAFNSLIKIAFLLFILNKIFPKLFKGKPLDSYAGYGDGGFPKLQRLD
ncbi:MAG TPA: hypothetical protein PKM27_01780 [Saprospiraceae bacterium]|nr:hypothetical protein [Saprospiraceae bacterium]HNT19452.1 hypothetical protein [Saprospiraceae bacterium]